MKTEEKKSWVFPDLNDSTLSFEHRVAILILQRDDVRNALTGTAIMDDIVKTVNWANCNSEISVLIITGDGKTFSSGGNVKAMLERSDIFNGTPIEIQDQYRRVFNKCR